VTLSASHFIVTRRDTGALAGHAVICVEARYASTRLFGEVRLLRGFVHGSQWKTIETDLQTGWEKGHVQRGATVAMALLPGELDSQFALQWLTTRPIEAADGGAAEVLDAFLRAQEEG
jgi:hypothetical protein